MTYIKTFFASFVVVILTIGLFNWFVDPFGMFWSAARDGINAQKSEAGTRVRISKAYVPRDYDANVLLVGNSRVEMGIDPQSPLFEGARVYNQAMPGAGIQRQVDYAIDALSRNPNLHTIMIGVDLFDFLLEANPTAQDAKDKRGKQEYFQRLGSSFSAEWFQLKEKASMALSVDATVASVRTLLTQGKNVNYLNKQGFNSARGFVDTMRFEGIKPLFRQKLDEVYRRIADKDFVISYEEDSSPAFEHLKRLMRAAEERDLEVHVFINPYHVTYLQTIADAGYWSIFADWKEMLLKHLDTPEFSDTALWDFSLLNAITMETVTTASPNQQMQWYWEPAHYKAELGEKMLSVMLLDEKPGDFGNRLTQASLSDSLREDHQALAANKESWQALKSTLGLTW